MAGKVQMVYLDPPYGISYASNFQPTIGNRQVKDGQDESITREPEQIKAYRDTWELGIHSWLTYLRDRLLLCRELLSDTGSVFVQINHENLQYVCNVMEEVFGRENFCGIIAFRKTGGLQTKLLASVVDYLVWYARDKEGVKFRRIFLKKEPGEIGATQYRYVLTGNGKFKQLSRAELAEADPDKVFTHDNLTSQGNPLVEFRYNGRIYKDRYKTNPEGLAQLAKAGRLLAIGNTLRYVRYLRDSPYTPINQFWHDTGISGFEEEKHYVVQTSPDVIARCILMTTDPGDLVFDPTCGSGTTAVVAEKYGRRWITCDTSRVALALARQRLLTSVFPYYQLSHPAEGLKSGFDYEVTTHVMLSSITQNEQSEVEVLYDRPKVDDSVVRVSGPLTVEGIPAPTIDSTIAQVKPEDISGSDDYVSALVSAVKADRCDLPRRKEDASR